MAQEAFNVSNDDFIQGRVIDSLMGAIKPIEKEIVDVCILFVSVNDSEEIYGLVEDISDCTFTQKYFRPFGHEGLSVEIPRTMFSEITDPDLIQIFQRINSKAKYFISD